MASSLEPLVDIFGDNEVWFCDEPINTNTKSNTGLDIFTSSRKNIQASCDVLWYSDGVLFIRLKRDQLKYLHDPMSHLLGIADGSDVAIYILQDDIGQTTSHLECLSTVSLEDAVTLYVTSYDVRARVKAEFCSGNIIFTNENEGDDETKEKTEEKE
jgi:hypothetical protein